MRILVSAGEASGDRYAAELVAELKQRLPNAQFFGCAGPKLREQGVEAVVRSEDLAVVGLFEVVRHIPRIWGEFRRLTAEAERRRPQLALLTDAPDFNLRLAKKLHQRRVPVAYYVAPQVWAWRKRRIRLLQRLVDQLLCIFPFEQAYFEQRGVRAAYVGHPLSSAPGVRGSREEFCRRHGLDPALPLVALLPGSRQGEAGRNLPPALDAIDLLRARRELNVVLPASNTTGKSFFEQRVGGRPVHIVENETRDALAHADAAFVASGTATVEAALLGAPMVVFYRVSAASYRLGRMLVDVPFYSMVNLLADKAIVPELIQHECTGERLAAEMEKLLDDAGVRSRMKADLAAVADQLRGPVPAARRAAEVICERFNLSA